MPKKLPYGHRFQAMRRAVYTITLREGVDAICMPAVAAELDLSVSTLRRLLATATYLPALGLEWVEYRERCRWSAPIEGGFTRREIDEVESNARWACNDLLRELPATPDQRDDALVRRLLTGGFPREKWALAATRTYQLVLAAKVDRALPTDLPADVRAFEATRLISLVLGSIEAVCQDAIRPEESVAMVRRHLSETFPAWLADTGRGAA